MNLTLKKFDFHALLSKATSVTENKATMPILASVLLDAHGDTLSVSAYDLEVAYLGYVGAEVKKPGKVAVSAKALGDVVRSLPDEVVSLLLEKNRLVVKSGSAEFRLATSPVEEFPALPVGVEGVGFVIDGAVFARALDEVAYAQSHDETRYSLNGTLLEGLDGSLAMTATDGHRLAHTEVAVEGVKFDGVIVSRKTSTLLRRVLVAGEAKVDVSENAVLVRQGHETLVARLIDGGYPNYRQVTPEKTEPTSMDAKKLTSVLGRMKLVDEKTVWKFENGWLEVSASNPDLGDVTEGLGTDFAGKTRFALNGQYLRETLHAWSGDTVLMQIPTDELSPVLLTSGKNEASWAVIMPVRM